MVQILALKAPGAMADMNTIAERTGGVVETTAGDSSDIVEKILKASSQELSVCQEYGQGE